MTIWHPITLDEWLTYVEQRNKEGKQLRLLSKEHLGDEEEPMELFIWGDSVSNIPVLRSAITSRNDLYWRAQ